jgi:hypothetical protein
VKRKKYCDKVIKNKKEKEANQGEVTERKKKNLKKKISAAWQHDICFVILFF